MRTIKVGSMVGIDKTEIDKLIAEKKFIGLNKSPRNEEVIISLTSYDKRIHDVKYTIYSLLNQTFPADKLILWLDEDSFPQREENLPQDLLALKEFGLTIDWCENLRPYKKLIPALEKYPDAIIATADDDIFYDTNWLGLLYEEHLKYPDCVIAHRCRYLLMDTQENILPYTDWYVEVTPQSPKYKNFFTGAGGVLYAKNFFKGDILRKDIFMELIPIADDIWFWAMAVLNGTKIKIPSNPLRHLIYVDTDMQTGSENLYSQNKTQNDEHLQKVFEKYPELINVLIRENVEDKPYISIILLLKDVDKFNENFINTFKQNFPEFEVIVVNVSTQFKSPTLPMNFRFINYPGGSDMDALNIGLRKAEGEYILFQDENSKLPRYGLSIVAQRTKDSQADVIHFAGHKQFSDEKFILDDAPELSDDKPALLDKMREKRAVLWFKDKLSGYLDTKIFRREFLTENGIKFEDDISDFMFQALIKADKYLIVPQAFCFCKD